MAVENDMTTIPEKEASYWTKITSAIEKQLGSRYT
jgi:hypothetical protein